MGGKSLMLSVILFCSNQLSELYDDFVCSVGDFGFDPLGLSDTINQNYARAAELKNGRVAMLACVGFLVQQSVHFVADEPNPFKAIEAVGYMSNVQIFSAIGAVELATWDKTFSGSSAPGNSFRLSYRDL